MPLRETVGDVWVRVHADGTGLDKDVKDELDDLDPVYEKGGEKNADAYNRGFLARMKARLAALEAPLGRLNKRVDAFATRLGRLTGKGSRNNALNFLGRMNENFIRMLGLIPRVGEKIAAFAGGGGAGEGISGLGKAIGSAALSAGLLVTGFVAISALIAPLVAGLSMLTGIITALAISLGAAVIAVGALAVGIGFTLVAAIGVGVLALQNLDDETKKVAKSVGNEFKKLGKSAGEAIGPGLRKALEIVKPAIAELEPLIDAVAVSLGKVAIGFAKITESKAYKDFINSLTKFLPDAIESLGTSFGNIGTAFMGVFRAMEPMLRRFLGWLEEVTAEFSDFANSAKGQKELKRFFKEAGDSAALLGDLIGGVVRAFANLAEAGGKKAGDTLLQDMVDQVTKLADWLGDPKNQKKVRQWFADAVEAARTFGHAVEDLIELIDKLDGPKSRAAFNGLIDAIGLVFRFWGAGADFWGARAEDMMNAIGTIREFVGRVVGFVRSIPDRVGNIWGKFKENASEAVQSVLGFFRRLPGRIIDFLSKLPGRFSDLLDRMAFQAGVAVGKIIKFFRELPGRIAAAAVGLVARMASIFARVVQAIPGIINKIVGFFRELPGKIANAIGDLWGKIKQKFDAAVTGVEGLVGDIVGAFTGLAGKILSAIGTIDIGSLIKWPGGKAGSIARNFVEGVQSGLTANGGVFTGAQSRIIGEAGPEAVVPLNRPLNMVDPSVRALSAIAQGKLASGGVSVPAGKTLNVGPITINTPTENPRAVAVETVNRLALVGGF